MPVFRKPTSEDASTATSISKAELDVMDVLWRMGGRQPASTVAAQLEASHDWSLQTVKTLLSRLTDKGAAEAVRDGRRFLYGAVLSRESHAREAARSLSDRLFGGRAAPLVAHLADAKGLSASDLDELEAIVARLRDDAS